MGRKHTRAELLAGAVDAAFDDGLSRLTFGRVAKRLGVADRTLVYYFPTKDELISEVVSSVGTQLERTLAPAFADRATDHREVVRAAWPVLAQPAADPVFALFFEANGLAAAGREPYATLVPQLVERWISWVAAVIDDSSTRCRAEAETAIAVVDGLLLLRQLGGPDAAERAARIILEG
jgi:AcrR family transcriptional regulator